MTSLRGGFRSVARGVTGSGAPARPQSTARRVLGTVITVALLAAAVALLIRRFGAGH